MMHIASSNNNTAVIDKLKHGIKAVSDASRELIKLYRDGIQSSITILKKVIGCISNADAVARAYKKAGNIRKAKIAGAIAISVAAIGLLLYQNKKINVLTRQGKELSSQNDELKLNNDELRRTHRETMKEYEVSNAKLQRDFDNLQQQKEKLQNELSIAKDKNNVNDGTINKLKNRISELDKEMEELTTKHKKIKADLATKESDNKSLRDTIHDLKLTANYKTVIERIKKDKSMLGFVAENSGALRSKKILDLYKKENHLKKSAYVDIYGPDFLAFVKKYLYFNENVLAHFVNRMIAYDNHPSSNFVSGFNKFIHFIINK